MKMFLSKMKIENFRGIKAMNLTFNERINVLIGENGSSKSTIIDAIRLLYSLGEYSKEIYIKNDDFYSDLRTGESENKITIMYEFEGLTESEQGALYEYLVLNPDRVIAQITLTFERRIDKFPKFDFYTGANPGQKANTASFEIFQHYYLGALRDSTNDLLSSKRNILGRVIKRGVEDNESAIIDIFNRANTQLLEREEISRVKANINENLRQIYSSMLPVGLNIEQSRIDHIVNVIKPYLPFSTPAAINTGLSLFQNSLGYNNLIYIATVLSDMNDRVSRDELIHYVLLIEEPEAHLHPQLQLNLYNFLKNSIPNTNLQLFITTHSPTLTSKTELDNLFIVDNSSYKCIANCFKDRLGENLQYNGRVVAEDFFISRKKMLERYIDVTKSQMFYARSLLLVEGISEELLLSAFAAIDNFKFEEYDIELLQTGTSFYPFLLLFNSSDQAKNVHKKIAVLTDDDRFTDSKDKEWAFNKLIENDFRKLGELYHNISTSSPSTRIDNLNNFKNNQENIGIFTSYKTFEYDIALSNVVRNKGLLLNNFYVRYLKTVEPTKFTKVEEFLDACGTELSEDEKAKVALLLWKLSPPKAEFAQDFAQIILDDIKDARENFIVPDYIKNSFRHVR
jgi:putative ATP-dependent endonuclease of the OLD family